MLYHGFPSKLHREVLRWAETGALFHIRVAVDREQKQSPLTTAPLAQAFLDSARFYATGNIFKDASTASFGGKDISAPLLLRSATRLHFEGLHEVIRVRNPSE